MRKYHFYSLHAGLRSYDGNSLGSVDFVCTRTFSPLVQRVLQQPYYLSNAETFALVRSDAYDLHILVKVLNWFAASELCLVFRKCAFEITACLVVLQVISEQWSKANKKKLYSILLSGATKLVTVNNMLYGFLFALLLWRNKNTNILPYQKTLSAFGKDGCLTLRIIDNSKIPSPYVFFVKRCQWMPLKNSKEMPMCLHTFYSWMLSYKLCSLGSTA